MRERVRLNETEESDQTFAPESDGSRRTSTPLSADSGRPASDYGARSKIPMSTRPRYSFEVSGISPIYRAARPKQRYESQSREPEARVHFADGVDNDGSLRFYFSNRTSPPRMTMARRPATPHPFRGMPMGSLGEESFHEDDLIYEPVGLPTRGGSGSTLSRSHSARAAPFATSTPRAGRRGDRNGTGARPKERSRTIL